MNAIVPASDLRKIEQAEQLFRGFFGRKPTDSEIVQVCFPDRPETCLVIGELDGLMYKTKYDAKPFMHRMGEESGDRPLLVVSSDGRQLYVLRGAYRFTSRGFVD